jgi:hypothetical protein
VHVLPQSSPPLSALTVPAPSPDFEADRSKVESANSVTLFALYCGL